MLRFITGFALGVWTCVGLLLIEEYLENASLREDQAKE